MHGNTYDMEALTRHCLGGYRQAMRECLIDDDAIFAANLKDRLSAMRNIFPSFSTTIAVLLGSAINECVPACLLGSVINLLLSLGVIFEEEIEEVLKFKFDNLPEVTLKDWNFFDPYAFCPNILYTFINFIRASWYQGEISSNRPEEHDKWHMLSGKALRYGGRAAAAVEKMVNDGTHH